MLPQTAVETYLQAIAARDYAAIMALFAATARVVHPIFGEQSAADFFRTLLAKTRSDQPSHPIVFQACGRPDTFALYFEDDWTSQEGSHFHNSIVLIFEFEPGGKVQRLRVIFDTHPFRTQDREGNP